MLILKIKKIVITNKKNFLYNILLFFIISTTQWFSLVNVVCLNFLLFFSIFTNKKNKKWFSLIF